MMKVSMQNQDLTKFEIENTFTRGSQFKRLSRFWVRSRHKNYQKLPIRIYRGPFTSLKRDRELIENHLSFRNVSKQRKSVFWIRSLSS